MGRGKELPMISDIIEAERQIAVILLQKDPITKEELYKLVKHPQKVIDQAISELTISGLIRRQK